MSNLQEQKKINRLDLTYNRVSASTFLFYLQVACIIALLLGSCYMLYTKRFNTRNVEVRESTLYTPKYK